MSSVEPAGPLFKFNPSVSFIVNFDPSREPDAVERLDRTWAKLIEGGRALMPLDAYPFSPRYGWVQDRFGLSWQLIQSEPSGEPRPAIVPALMFTGEVAGKAEQAGTFYRSVFDGSRAGQLVHRPAGSEHDAPGTVMFSDFRLDETWFAAMDSAYPHGFGFNEAISFMIHCRDQVEPACRRRSSAAGADRYGVSWQITPVVPDELMTSADQAIVDRVTRAFLDMKKLDVAAIEAAAREV